MQLSTRSRPRAAASLLAALLVWAGGAHTAHARSQEANLVPLAPFWMSAAADRPAGVRGDLLLASDGNFYLTSSSGGSEQRGGSIIRVTPGGTITTLHSFTGGNTDGATPYAGLMQASDGSLYGTTYVGGTDSRGTVFRITLAGEFSLLYSFVSANDGAFFPYAGLVQAGDGNLYGSTLRGGPDDKGTVFRISTSGTFAIIHSFAGSDGENPEGTLVVGANGELYGTTLTGGASNRGTIYRISTSGTFTSVYSFPALGAFNANGVATNTAGANPRSALLLSTDGNFYGTAYQGGASGYGTVFRMTPSGDVTALHSFTGASAGGAFPLAGVIRDASGNIYGTTERGGYLNQGSAWRLSSSGQFSLLHGFLGTVNDGNTPYAGLYLLGDSLYGASYSDGTSALGGVYKLELGSGGTLPVELSVTPASMLVGASANLTWSSPTATACTTAGSWTDTVGITGSLAVTPAAAGIYTYVLVCTDGAGIARNAYASLTVNAPPTQSVDGGGGGGALSYPLLLLLLGTLLWKVRGLHVADQA
jgi:uncharacterized repeat protein (TIGR03803 family)